MLSNASICPNADSVWSTTSCAASGRDRSRSIARGSAPAFFTSSAVWSRFSRSRATSTTEAKSRANLMAVERPIPWLAPVTIATLLDISLHLDSWMSCLNSDSVDDNHLSAGLVRFHHPMGFANVVETKHSGRFRFEPPGSNVFSDLLKRHVGKWKTRRAEHETAEERQVHTARHLQKRVEIDNRIEAAQPARKTRATTSSQHGEGIKNGAVADEVEHGIELLRFGDALRKVGAFDLDACGAQAFEHRDTRRIACCRDDLCAGIDREVHGRLSERRCRPSDDNRLPLCNLEVAEQARPRRCIGFRNDREFCPLQPGLDQCHVGHRCPRVLRVAPVDGSPKTTHQRSDF